MPKRARSFKAGQLERLKDPVYAAEYVNAAVEAGDNAALLLALRNVAEAQSMNAIAQQARLSRESIYRMLSENGNPCYTSLVGILGALGFQIRVQATHKPVTLRDGFWGWISPLWEVGDSPKHYACDLTNFSEAQSRLTKATYPTRHLVQDQSDVPMELVA